MQVLFIGAHPDDIEFGCAGTIKKLCECGCLVSLILMSYGENDLNKSENKRLEELKKSVHMLGIDYKNVYFMKCADGFVTDNAETIGKLSNIISEIAPDLICTHFYDDRHQDHRNTSYCVRSACWGKYNLMFFQSFSTMNFQPSIFVDISHEINFKVRALRCYESQLKKYEDRNIDFLEMSVSIDRNNGGNIHSEYAEGYVSANCVWVIKNDIFSAST